MVAGYHGFSDPLFTKHVHDRKNSEAKKQGLKVRNSHDSTAACLQHAPLAHTYTGTHQHRRIRLPSLPLHELIAAKMEHSSVHVLYSHYLLASRLGACVAHADLQTVSLNLRVLYRPNAANLP